mmetsp:Transcript_27587/g.50935  ORF Transcript_27587/g.50935 Transcript_27587/m.50935 type:complete len:211 (-) Transcript_27587:97-729(-)
MVSTDFNETREKVVRDFTMLEELQITELNQHRHALLLRLRIVHSTHPLIKERGGALTHIVRVTTLPDNRRNFIGNATDRSESTIILRNKCQFRENFISSRNVFTSEQGIPKDACLDQMNDQNRHLFVILHSCRKCLYNDPIQLRQIQQSIPQQRVDNVLIETAIVFDPVQCRQLRRQPWRQLRQGIETGHVGIDQSIHDGWRQFIRRHLP